jgi:hypothetical protein
MYKNGKLRHFETIPRRWGGGGIKDNDEGGKFY